MQSGISALNKLFSGLKKSLIAFRNGFKNLINKIGGILFKTKKPQPDIQEKLKPFQTQQSLEQTRLRRQWEKEQQAQKQSEQLIGKSKELEERRKQLEKDRIAAAQRMQLETEAQVQRLEQARIARLRKEEADRQEKLEKEQLKAAAEAKKAAERKAAREAKLKELADVHYKGQPGEMRLVEKNIIAALEKIEQDQNSSYEITEKNEKNFQELIIEYQQALFGNSTEAFLNHSTLKLYLSELHAFTKSEYSMGGSHLSDKTTNFRLWMLIEHYSLEKSEIKKTNYLKRIKTELQQIRKEIYKPSGQGLFKQLKPALIKNVYLVNDPKLINLFMNNPTTKLPIPDIFLFEGGPIPAVIQKRHDEAQSATAAFIKRLPYGEAWVTHLQREVRRTQRERKEKSRLAQFFFYTRRQIQVGNKCRYQTEPEIQAQIEQALKDSNTPYVPKECSPEFAQRLVEAASKVKLFDTIRHETSETYLNLILDEGLKGRKTLLEQGHPFKPGALWVSDLETGGDANVICFGVEEICPRATRRDPIQIILDVNKIKPNPCMFYKQRDFNYSTKTIHQTSLKEAFYFTHGDFLRCGSGGGYTNLQIKNKSEGLKAVSELPAHFFMAFDVSKMHQILTLNFFRFIDTLCTPHGEPDLNRIKEIYTSLEKIFKEGGEEALVKELERIGIEMTRTAEVNFYSTYLIDFQALKSINSSSFTLELPRFIVELQKGNIDQLMAAQRTQEPRGIPNVFKSYRFLDYLLSKPHVDHYPDNILAELNRIKALCPKPAYLEAQYKAPSVTFGV